jgi:hypothetical protein
MPRNRISQYPTKKEILKKEPKLKKNAIILTINWKNSLWKEALKNKSHESQKIAIASLIETLAQHIYKKPLKSIIEDGKYSYNAYYKRITFGEKPSIISALHELGHHLYGKSELLACRFSVHLFKKCFPQTYRKLKWEGHQLKKHI